MDDRAARAAIERAWPGWRVSRVTRRWMASRGDGGSAAGRSPALLTVSIAEAEGCAAVVFDGPTTGRQNQITE